MQLQQDLDKIREFYQDHGYIDVEVKDVRRARMEKGPMILTIVIVEGPAVSRAQADHYRLREYDGAKDPRVAKNEGRQCLFAQAIAR